MGRTQKSKVWYFKKGILRFEHGLASAILIHEYIGYSCLMVFDNLGPEPLGLID